MSDPTHIKDLIQDPRNARKHNPRNIGMIADALQEVGAARSIVIDEDNVILAGNGAIEAAAQAGITNVRVIEANGNEVIAVRRSGLTAQQKARLALFDNRTAELAEWDADVIREFHDDGVLEGMFSDDEYFAVIDEAAPREGQTDDDATPAEPTDVWVKTGDVFQLGRHRLVCGDTTARAVVAVALDGRQAECVFTSPPYGVGIDYGTYQDTIANLRAMLPVLAERWRDVVMPGGFAVVNFGDIISGTEAAGADGVCEYPMALEYWPAFRAAGWALWSRRVWLKPHARVNSLWSMSTNRASTDFEHVWTWKTLGAPVVQRIDNPVHTAYGWVDTRDEESPEHGKDIHGAAMPVAVPVACIQMHTHTGNMVFEPFGGTGTTLIACEKLDRVCCCTEIEPRYVQMIIDRWQSFTGQLAEKIGSDVVA